VNFLYNVNTHDTDEGEGVLACCNRGDVKCIRLHNYAISYNTLSCECVALRWCDIVSDQYNRLPLTRIPVSTPENVISFRLLSGVSRFYKERKTKTRLNWT